MMKPTTMATLTMLAANFALLYTVAVQAQTVVPLETLISHYGITVFTLRAQGTCNEPCQEISPIHCQEQVPTYTIFSPSAGKNNTIHAVYTAMQVAISSIILSYYSNCFKYCTNNL